MSEKPKIVAFVPMRHASERVVGKNYRPLGGMPLYHHITKTLLACPQIDEVYIDTDSPIIIADAQENFPTVKIILRPENLRSGMTSMNDVLRNSIAQVDADIYIQTHSTNPLLKAASVSRAIESYLGQPEKDSLFGVTRLQTRLYQANGKALNHDPKVLLRTQDLPPVYEENSNIYIFSKDVFLQRGNRIGANPILFEIERDEAWDIDEEVDFRIAELLYLNRKELL